MNKYKAKRVDCPLYGKFDSQGEYSHYLFLINMKAAGYIIGDIKRQVTYHIILNGQKICKVIPDYEYTLRDGTLVTSDFKGMLLPIAKLKFKLFEAQYGRKIFIVKSERQWHN